MNIKLRSLNLRNFKGIKELSMSFNDETNIYGDNASGKTTIFDAFTWLLSGKDSTDRTTFNIKTLNREGNVIHGIEHEVEGVLEVNNVPLILKKVYKEKWTKKKGEAEKQLTGHTTTYWIDEVPVRKKDYVEKMESLISEDVFKLITNPFFFNAYMEWTERRELLDQIVGGVEDSDIMAQSKNLEPLTEILAGKSIDSFKKIVAVQKKKLNDAIKAIPIRIDELYNSLPSLNVDFDAIEQQLAMSQLEVKDIEVSIQDSSKFYENISRQRSELYDKKLELQQLEYTAKLEKDKPLTNLKAQRDANIITARSKANDLKALESRKKEVERILAAAKSRMVLKRDEWHKVNAEVLEFNEHEFTCPTCNRDFEEVDIETKKQEMNQRFIENKANKIKEINEEGLFAKEKVTEYQKELDEIEPDIEIHIKELAILDVSKMKIEDEIKSYSSPTDSLSTNQEYISLKKEIEAMEQAIDSSTMDKTVEKLRLEKERVISEIDSLKIQLSTKTQHEQATLRINDLKVQEKSLAGQIAEIEGQEYLCDEFTREKANYLESRVNSNFERVTFKLFNTLVNGNIEECCETLIDGVPFDDANTEGQVNGGIDIINSLSKHFGVSAPMFIDNREGVIKLQGTDAQVINLSVKEIVITEKAFLKELNGTNNKTLYMEVI